MPLTSTYGPLFTPAWVAALKSTPESGMTAIIRISNPKASQSIYDPATDSWNDVDQVVFFGKARVQPLRSAAFRDVSGDDTTVQTVLVSLPIDAATGIDFRTGFIGQIIDAPLNPDLLTYQLVIGEIMDSSNPIERTLMFTVNQETVAV